MARIAPTAAWQAKDAKTLEQAAPSRVHRPVGMGIDEFVKLMCATLTKEGTWASAGQQWLDEMTTDEMTQLRAECDAIRVDRAR